MNAMRTECREIVPKVYSIKVLGKVDFSSAAELRRQIDLLLVGEETYAVVDLDGVVFIDSSGLGILVRAAREHFHQIAIACTVSQTLRLLSITAMNQVLPIYAAEDDALQALRLPGGWEVSQPAS